MPELNPLDLYDVRAELSDDERMVQDSVARFVDDEVLPIIGQCFAEQRFPRELVPAIASLGLFGPTLSDYGCSARSWSAVTAPCAAWFRCRAAW